MAVVVVLVVVVDSVGVPAVTGGFFKNGSLVFVHLSAHNTLINLYIDQFKK